MSWTREPQNLPAPPGLVRRPSRRGGGLLGSSTLRGAGLRAPAAALQALAGCLCHGRMLPAQAPPPPNPRSPRETQVGWQLHDGGVDG
eukprot:scaffold15517_cov114-Isochrysis_galbana.AAC.1